MDNLERRILRDYYDYRKGDRSAPNFTEYELKYKGSNRAKHEYAYYLSKLKRDGYLTFEDSNVIHPGGIRDKDYGNSVAMIFTENVEITDETKVLFEPKTTKIAKVLKEESKDFAKTVNREVKGYFAKWVAAIIILIILIALIKVLDVF